MRAQETRLGTASIDLGTAPLIYPGERSLRSVHRDAALAVGTGRQLDRSPNRTDWVLSAVRRGTVAALVVGRVKPGATLEVDPTELALDTPDSSVPDLVASFPGEGILAAACDDGVAWWAGSAADTVLGVVTAEGQVHMLADPMAERVHSEPFCDGDRMVAISRSIADPIEDLDSLLEMALIDSPSAAGSCLWLMDAAEDAGAVGPLFTAVWHHRDPRPSAG